MNLIDKLNRMIGNAVAWLVLLMVIGTLYNVVARYYFEHYSIPVGEMVIILNSAVFLLSAPLLLALDQHVRVDVFYSRMSTKKQAVVDLLGTLFLLFPFCGFILRFSWGYVASSWTQLEGSGQTGGLPGLYLVKSLIVIVAILLIAQGLSMIITKIKLIQNPDSPHIEHHPEETPL